LPAPPRGRPKRPTARAASVRGRLLGDYPDLLLEWAWDVDGELDPGRLTAGSHERVAWRFLLEPAHLWETRVADRTYQPNVLERGAGLGPLGAVFPAR
jgi:hypothetical protein